MPEQPYYHGVSLFDLWKQRHEIPRQQWIVEGMLPAGFSILAGREKSGKSILSFGSVAIPIALGSNALGTLNTKEGVVLYFSLEEGLSMVRDRLEQFFANQSDTWYPPANLRLFLSDAIESWTDAAIDQLEGYIKEFSDVRCVVIDTLRLLAPLKKQGNLADGYDFEYAIGSRLQQMALRYKVAILAIHHTVKSSYGDIFDTIGGSAWTKAAESMMVVERDGQSIKLHIRGRSVPTACWRLKQDEDTLLWTRTDTDDTSIVRPRRRSQLDDLTVTAVFDNGMKLRHSEIKRRITSRGFGESSVDRWLEKRIQEGELVKHADGSGYSLRVSETEAESQQELPLHHPDKAVASPPPSSSHIENENDDGTASIKVDHQEATDDALSSTVRTPTPAELRAVTHKIVRRLFKRRSVTSYKDIVVDLRKEGVDSAKIDRWLDAAEHKGYLWKGHDGCFIYRGKRNQPQPPSSPLPT
ncbi:MAG: AAA family ATPase [Candidatus Kapaibacterium sp.]|nr:MAG: AAA family ATPase [Candidatus Kapabacteria bacterium]